MLHFVSFKVLFWEKISISQDVENQLSMNIVALYVFLVKWLFKKPDFSFKIRILAFGFQKNTLNFCK